jgi:hypothetical protein
MQQQYKVLWKGYPLSEATWEPAHNLTDFTDEIKEYENSRVVAPQ